MAWQTLLPFIIWGIWINRNKNNVNNTNFTTKLNTLIKSPSEYILLNTKGGPTQARMSVKISWHKPQKNWYKLNTDGAYKDSTQKSGIGGMIRNHTGKWILGFQKQITAFSSLQTEIHAIHEGLQIATKYGLFPLEVETDSTEVIKAIHQNHLVFTNIILACRSLMHHRKDLLLQHNFKEGNQVAHILAKNATTESYRQLYLQCPKIHATPPLFLSKQSTMEENGAYPVIKTISTDANNRLRSLGNQCIAPDNPPMCGTITTICNHVNVT